MSQTTSGVGRRRPAIHAPLRCSLGVQRKHSGGSGGTRLTGRMATLSGTVFTPQRLLLLFCCINMIVYIDRGEHMVMPAACNAGMQSQPAAAPG